MAAAACRLHDLEVQAPEQSIRLVVSRTFLDFTTWETQPRLRREKTDSALCGPGRGLPPMQEYHFNAPPLTPLTPLTQAPSTTLLECDSASDSCAPSVGSEEDRAVDADDASVGPCGGRWASTCSVGGSSTGAGASAAGSKAAGRGPRPARKRLGQPEHRTTLMLRNVPNSYTRDMFLAMLDAEGFRGFYDFAYLPMDFDRGCGLGYAFVNLTNNSLVPQFRATFDGYSAWTLRTSKVCRVTWSDRDQGLKANVKRYRNNPVMHPSVPDEYRPCLFSNGERAPFPLPIRCLDKPSKRAV